MITLSNQTDTDLFLCKYYVKCSKTPTRPICLTFFLSFLWQNFAQLYILWKIFTYFYVFRVKSFQDSWGAAFVYDWQLPLIFVQWTSNFLCMCTYCTAHAQEVWGKSDKRLMGLSVVHKSYTSTILEWFDSSTMYLSHCMRIGYMDGINSPVTHLYIFRKLLVYWC